MKQSLKKTLALAGVLPGVLAAIVVLRAVFVGADRAADIAGPDGAPALLQVDDPDAAAERLAGAIRIKTISIENAPFRAAEFAQLRDHLERNFPLAHRALERQTIAEHSLLYTWRGSAEDATNLKPILILAHQDVVPVGIDQQWEQPPFRGTVVDGYIWGRGTLDMKAGLVGVFEAIERLLAQGYRPERTIYLALGHDEERTGLEGAGAIAQYFRERGVSFDMIQDEGMIIADGLVPGVTRNAALIGIAQKGEGSLELTVSGDSGHSSMPPRHTTVGILASAISRIEANPMPASLSGPTELLFESLAGEMGFGNRLIFANLWLFSPLVRSIMEGKNQTNASIRTTLAATMARGSAKDNILPARAVGVVNMRIHPRDSIADVVEHVTRVVDDERVRIRVMEGAQEPSRVSPVDSEQYALYRRSIHEVFPDVASAPALFIAIADSRHFKDLSKNIYRFQPMVMKSEDLARIHGVNERISIDAYTRYIQFYGQLIRNGAGRRGSR